MYYTEQKFLIYGIRIVNKLKSTKLNEVLWAVLALIILFVTAKLMLKGVGISSSERNDFLLLTLIVILSSSKKAFWILVFPMSVLYSLYSPIGLIFGEPNYQYVASIFSTDLLESKEFFQQIPIFNYFCPLFIIFGVLLYRIIIVKKNIEFYRNKTLISIFVIFSMVNQSPAEFFKSIISSSLKVKDELINLNEFKPNSDWGKSYLENSKYDNYILVIGESARKDYHNAYGYPIVNTPFMSESKGFLVDGLTSGGVNTIASLRLMLTNPDVKNWLPNYNLTFIDLVKSAGIKTYWISNQGYFGQYDTPISAIANRSDSKYFIKSGDYSSKNTSDFLLIDKVKTVVNRAPNEKKLIVIHLYGSHPNACDRVIDYKKIVGVSDKKYSYIDCYISSINKTDDFLRELNSFMTEEYFKNKASYSILYFSDHGLAHQDIDGIIRFNNNRPSKLHYNIPLFKISSDSNERKKCFSFKSGLNFVNGIASWIGIKNNKLRNDYSLFDCKNDPDDYGLKHRIDSITGELDPAIDIRGK